MSGRNCSQARCGATPDGSAEAPDEPCGLAVNGSVGAFTDPSEAAASWVPGSNTVSSGWPKVWGLSQASSKAPMSATVCGAK
eukprot:10993448-Karenia_brevis.AAC.1